MANPNGFDNDDGNNHARLGMAITMNLIRRLGCYLVIVVIGVCGSTPVTMALEVADHVQAPLTGSTRARMKSGR